MQVLSLYTKIINSAKCQKKYTHTVQHILNILSRGVFSEETVVLCRGESITGNLVLTTELKT